MTSEPAEEDGSGGRSMHLLGGRRVRVSDLLEAGLLRGDKRIAVDFNKLLQKGDLTQNIKL